MQGLRFAALLAFFVCGTAQAEPLTTSPERLIISATKGDELVRDIAVVGSTSWTLQAMPFSTVDGAEQDTKALSIHKVSANGADVVRLTFKLDDTDTGAYRTEVLIRNGASVVVRVPVEVSVKAGAMVPLLLLIAGAAIGFWMSYYRRFSSHATRSASASASCASGSQRSTSTSSATKSRRTSSSRAGASGTAS